MTTKTFWMIVLGTIMAEVAMIAFLGVGSELKNPDDRFQATLLITGFGMAAAIQVATCLHWWDTLRKSFGALALLMIAVFSATVAMGMNELLVGESEQTFMPFLVKHGVEIVILAGLLAMSQAALTWATAYFGQWKKPAA